MRRSASLVPKPSHCLVLNEWTCISVKCENFSIWSLSVVLIVSECSLPSEQHQICILRHSEQKLLRISAKFILTKVRD